MAKIMDSMKWREACQQAIRAGKDGLTPGRGRILVARDPRDEFLSRDSKLVAPDASKEQKQTGAVLILGPKRENAMGSEVDYVFSVGDKILMNQYAGKPVNLFGLELVVIEESDIFLRLNRDAFGG